MSQADLVAVNGTTLYDELRGEGPPVMFISGPTGDAGHWTEVADALVDDYTVLAYDRRANSRRPRPANWSAAPIDEQADDAAQLLRALGLAPAVVYGNSSGAVILTSLALRHPEVLCGAIFHEPPFAAVTSTSGAVGAERQALTGAEMVRHRMIRNGEVFFGLELESTMSYLPTSEELAQVDIPCVVAAGVENRNPTATHHWFYEASQWLAGQLGVSLIEMPGAHVPQATHAKELAAVLRPIIEELHEPSDVWRLPSYSGEQQWRASGTSRLDNWRDRPTKGWSQPRAAKPIS